MNKHLLSLTGIFIVSRVVFRLIFNIEFDDFLLDEGWQFLDTIWLENDLQTSIYYLHSQPPLGNLVCGILLQVFDDIGEPIHFILMSLNLLAILAFYLSCINLGIKRHYAFWAGIFLVFHPQFVLYENYFFYSVPVMSLITISVFFATQYFVSNKAIYIKFLFFSILLLALTRSMFHLVFIIGVMGFFYLFSNHKKESLLFGFIALFLCSSWYLKNKLEFGFFGASSWMGMNISRIMLEEEKIGTYLNEGPFRSLSIYENKGYKLKHEYPNVTVLHERHKKDSIVNFNNENYLYLSNEFKQASIEQLYENPTFYLTNVIKGNLFYYKPTIHYSHLKTNYNRLRIYSSLYILDIPSLLEIAGMELEKDVFVILSTIPPLIFHLFIYFLLFKYFRKIEWKNLNAENKQVLFITMFILFVMTVGNLLELYENNRFRFTTSTIFYLLSLYLLNLFSNKGRSLNS